MWSFWENLFIALTPVEMIDLCHCLLFFISLFVCLTYPASTLLNHLFGEIIPDQRNRNVPNVPPVVLPSRGDIQQLGTRSRDLDALDACDRENEEDFVKKSKDLRDKLEEI